MPQIKGQENRRFTDFFADQHGREYIGNCEIGLSPRAGLPPTTDPIDLVPNNWVAPITPAWARKLFMPPLDDHEIVRLLPRAERAKLGYQLHIDYTVWLRKHDIRTQAWKEHLNAIARTMSGGINVLKVIEEPPPALIEYVGAPPFPPRELIQAMAAGNAWALGLDDKVPTRAGEMLEKLRPAVMKTRQVIDLDALDDPFADELFESARPDDEAMWDLEEENDPLAEGGKRHPVRRGKAKGTKTEAAA